MKPDSLIGKKIKVPLFNVKQIFYERTQDETSEFITEGAPDNELEE